MNLDNFFQPLKEDILSIEWNDDPLDYDLQLYNLGNNNQKTWITNPYVEDNSIIHYIESVPDTDKCIVWMYNDQWIAKLFPVDWDSNVQYENVTVTKPKIVWNRNPDIDKLMTFESTPYGVYEPDPWDICYKHVWYLDNRVNPLDDKIWVFSCQAVGKEIKGIKEIGYLMPNIDVEYNSHLPKLQIDINECYPPFWELCNECAYELDPIHQTNEQLWVIKFSPTYRKPRTWKWLGTITPEYKVEYNPILGKLDYDINYIVPWHDLGYEHVWYLDRLHLQNGEDDIWAFKIKYISTPTDSKTIDYISPNYTIRYNKDLYNMNYNVNYVVPWHDLGYEHVWYLDRLHLQNNEDDIWAFKIKYTKKSQETKTVSYISPEFETIINPLIEGYKFNISYAVPYHDFEYEHVWYLDNQYSNGEKIWAIKIRSTAGYSGWKDIGSISPVSKISYNKALRDLKVKIDYVIPYYDREYEHVWYLDNQYSNNEKIWVVKIKDIANTVGEKEMGTVLPIFPERLDVVFISYYELNAEENWNRVLEKAPWAKRINGVEGIFNAHKAAAEIAETDMFYVVDGDAWLVDNWNFDYQPILFNRDCSYVWASQNPVNDLVYQNGGVKLFNKQALLEKEKWETLDMFSGLMKNIKSNDTVSCITTFNVDEFSAWRSAFREAVKLFQVNQMIKLDVWMTKGENRPFGKYVIMGAVDGYKYAVNCCGDQLKLCKINDYRWLKELFNEIRNR